MGSSFSSLSHSINEFIHAPATYRAAYVLGWGTLFGFNIWNSFVGGLVAYRALPRETFGLLQSHTIPAYLFTSSLISSGLLILDIKLRPYLLTAFRKSPLVTLSALNDRVFWTSTAGFALITAGLHLVNALVITPRATEIMFRRHRLKRIEGRSMEKDPSFEMQHLNKRFQTLHSLSSTLNVTALLTTGLIGWKIGSQGLGPKVVGGLGIMTGAAN